MSARRALWRSIASLTDGSTRPHSNATIPTPMATAASSIRTVVPATVDSGAPRCTGEEDDSVGVARDLRERFDHACFASPHGGALGDGGPHALIELAAELLDEQLLLLGHLDVPFGDQHLTVSGLHAKEPHGERRL